MSAANKHKDSSCSLSSTQKGILSVIYSRCQLPYIYLHKVPVIHTHHPNPKLPTQSPPPHQKKKKIKEKRKMVYCSYCVKKSLQCSMSRFQRICTPNPSYNPTKSFFCNSY
ncbi:hypothetical protein PanWU01x14_142700 [Parasponia andersonii]|uniref:Uncharacterized protein n=1 Tax=Parasponia andersonii TaxID=3476 RepID=A0A2P5CLD8_PARAD|nr:hypothetical protein PanWU01x14_142700 [Parasponia andersonii]